MIKMSYLKLYDAVSERADMHVRDIDSKLVSYINQATRDSHEEIFLLICEYMRRNGKDVSKLQKKSRSIPYSMTLGHKRGCSIPVEELPDDLKCILYEYCVGT